MRIVDPRTRLIAVALALLMVADVIFPTALFALSSGPSQPEVQGFQPAGTEDMVDLFSGDMSYNISLLDVEGYPVNLFYKAGPGMDQEASWVGLGWNLNAGVVERNLRGLPDDFDGGADAITRTMGLRPNQTMGVSLGLSLELFGLDNIGLSTTLSPSYNNYEGMQFQTGVSLSMRSTEGNKFSKSLDLGLTSHSSQSLRMQAGVSFDKTDGKVADAARPGLNFGLTLDGRQGLSNISFGAGLSTHDKAAKTTTRLGSLKGAYDIGPPTYTPMISMSMNNSSLSFNFTLGAALFGLHPNSRLGAFFSDNRLRASTVTNPAYGYLHMEHAGRNGMLDFNREKDGPYTGDISALSIVNMTNDVFSVNAQGLSGSYRAFRSEVGHVFDAAVTSTGNDGSFGAELGVGLLGHGGADVMLNQSTSTSGDWGGNMAANRLRFRASTEGNPGFEPAYFREASEATVEQDSNLWASMGGGGSQGIPVR